MSNEETKFHYKGPFKNPGGYTLPSNFAEQYSQSFRGPATLLNTLDGWDIWVMETPGNFFSVRLSDLLVEFDYYDGPTDHSLRSAGSYTTQSVREFILAYCRVTLSP